MGEEEKNRKEGLTKNSRTPLCCIHVVTHTIYMVSDAIVLIIEIRRAIIANNFAKSNAK